MRPPTARKRMAPGGRVKPLYHMLRSPLGKSDTPFVSVRALLGAIVALLALLSSCIPRWEKCAANDFTCNTGMQLLSFAPGRVVIVGGMQTSTPAYAVSTDDGETWTTGALSAPGATTLQTMNFADGRFLAGTGAASFFETRDSGKTWSLFLTPAAVSGIGHADGRYIAHVPGPGTVYALADGDSAWTSLGPGPTTSPSPTVVSAGGMLYILAQGTNGLQYHTSPSAWTQIDIGTATPYSLCTDNGMIYVSTNATTYGQLYSGQAGGTSFAPMGATTSLVPGNGNNYMACHGNTFVAPLDGPGTCRIVVSTNAGASWTTVDLGCAVAVAGATFTGKRYVAATANGEIFVSENALNWRRTMPSGSGYAWSGIAANQAAFYY